MLQVVNISLLVTEDCDVLSCIFLCIVGVNLLLLISIRLSLVMLD